MVSNSICLSWLTGSFIVFARMNCDVADDGDDDDIAAGAGGAAGATSAAG